MITLHELDGREIEIFAADIKRYRGSGYGTWIEMNSGTDFYVTEDFDSVDEMVENLKL
jgi:uncharacterized protein YlzI (FlbEa/FlbD family)